MADKEVSVSFVAKTASFSKNIQQLGSDVLQLKAKWDSMVSSAAQPIKRMGQALAGIGTVGMGSMALFTKNAIGFETEMRNVNSILRESEGGFESLKTQILGLAQSVPKSAEDLAGAAYDIVSSGFTNAADLNLILAASAKTATAGLTETKVAAGAIATVLKAYNMNAGQASYVSDVLFKTVDKGRVTFEQLSTQMGQFVSLSKAAGITLEESMGIYANLTVLTGQYAESATSVVGIARSFIKPSADMKNQMEKLFGPTWDTKVATEGLIPVLDKLTNSVGKNKQALAKLFPDTEGLRGVLSLMGVPLEEINAYMSEFTDKTKVTGSTQRVFKEQMKAVGNQFQLLKTGINAAGIELAQGFLPFLSMGVKFMGNFLGVWKSIPQPIKTVIGMFVAFGSAIAIITGALVALRAKQILTAMAMKAIGKEGTSLTGAILPNFTKGLTRVGNISTKTNLILNKVGLNTSFLGMTMQTTSMRMNFMNIAAGKVGGALVAMGGRMAMASGGASRLSMAATKAAATVKLLGGAVGIASKAFMAFLILPAINDMLNSLAGSADASEQSVSKMGKSLMDFQKSSKLGGEAAKVLGKDLAQLHTDAKRLDEPLFRNIDSKLPNWMQDPAMRGAKKNIDQLDKAMAAMVSSGAGKEAAAILDELKKRYNAEGWDFKLVETHLNDYDKAVDENAFSQSVLTAALGDTNAALDEQAGNVMEVTKAQGYLRSAFSGMAGVSALLGKAADKTSALKDETDEAAEKARDAKKAYNEWLDGTESRALRSERALRGVTAATKRVADIRKEIDKVKDPVENAKRIASFEDQLTAALEEQGSATKRLTELRKALDLIRNPPARDMREAEIALARALDVQAEATAKVKFQVEKLAFARLQGTAEEVATSERELRDAEWGLEEATWATEDATKNLNEMRAGGNPETVAALEDDITRAQKDEKVATDNVTQATKDLDKERKETHAEELAELTWDLEDALLAEKDAAIEAKDATHDLTYKTKDEAVPAVGALKGKVDEAKTSLQEFKAELKTLITDQNDWLTNLEHIAKTGPPGLAASLAQLGLDGARIVADLKDKTPKEMQLMFDQLNTQAILETDEWSDYIEAGLRSGKGRGETVTQEMVDTIASKLQISKDEALRLLTDYLNVAAPKIIAPHKSMWDNITGAIGGLFGDIGTFLNGLDQYIPPPEVAPGDLRPLARAKGSVTRTPQISNTPILWSEAGPEAYIPLNWQQRDRSEELLGQVANHFGKRLISFADGGMYRVAAGGGGNGGMTVNIPIHIEARVAAGVDMDYASRVIAQQVETGVRMALDRLGREMVVKSWRN